MDRSRPTLNLPVSSFPGAGHNGPPPAFHTSAPPAFLNVCEFFQNQTGIYSGQHYDVVLNGMELGGGSIRIHQPSLQKKVFEDVLKIPADVVESRFGYMLKAFTYGAPPHGGIAFGLDRMCALLCGTTSIRDVIAFPKTQKGQDLMAQSPTPVTAKQLKELHIQTVMPE